MKKNLMAVVLGLLIGGIGVLAWKNKSEEATNKKINKFKRYYYLLNEWMMIRNEEKSVDQYFVKHGLKKVAIYGMGEMGGRLYEELKKSNIKVVCGIDQNADNLFAELEIRSIEDEINDVDGIVVTPIFDYENIRLALLKKVNCPIISLEEVIFGL